MGEIYIKRQSDGTWHSWGAEVRAITGGWAGIAALIDAGFTIHWEGDGDLAEFIAEFGERPPIAQAD